MGRKAGAKYACYMNIYIIHTHIQQCAHYTTLASKIDSTYGRWWLIKCAQCQARCHLFGGGFWRPCLKSSFLLNRLVVVNQQRWKTWIGTFALKVIVCCFHMGHPQPHLTSSIPSTHLYMAPGLSHEIDFNSEISLQLYFVFCRNYTLHIALPGQAQPEQDMYDT